MTSRERVLTALDHEEPDRVPYFVGYTPEAGETLLSHLRAARSVDLRPEDIPLAMGHDLLVADHGVGTSYYANTDAEEYTCEWGIGWKWVDIPGGRYTEIVGHPLKDELMIDSWSPPDPLEPARYHAMRLLLETHGASHAIVGGMGSILFEPAWHLRGFEQFLSDLVINRDFAHILLDRIFNYQMASGKILAGLGADILWLGDDFGTQDSLIMSPATWREFFSDRYARLFTSFREVKPDIHIAFHSDGNVEPLLDEFIEVGVDIFQAVQPKAVDPAYLKRRYGDRLSFWGTMDIQETMPFGKPSDVTAEVRTRFETVAPGGGFIIAPSHAIQPDVPLDNVLAFYEAVDTYCRYDGDSQPYTESGAHFI